MLHAGGPALKETAAQVLAGSTDDLAVAGDVTSPVFERLWRAFVSDQDTVTAYRDARWARETAWKDMLEPYGAFGSVPEFDASIAAFMFGRQDMADRSMRGQPDYPKAGQEALDRIPAIMAERPGDFLLQFAGQSVLVRQSADDARRFLLYGGYLAAAPAVDSVEFRDEVEALKIRWASCDTNNPFNPDGPIKDIVTVAADEWDAELVAQAGPRADIVTAEAQAAVHVRTASDTMVQAMGLAWVAKNILAVQQGWLTCPTCSPVPTPELKAKATADLATIKQTVANLVTSAQQTVSAANTAAGNAEVAKAQAAQIAASNSTPYGRGLAYAQQSVQVTKASAAAVTAAKKATDTALQAVRSTAATSAALLSAAQTQSLALQTEFKRVAAQEAAAQAHAAAAAAATQAGEAAEAAARAATDRATAEGAEATAKSAAADAHAKRATADQERDIAAAQRATADAERMRAQQAEAEAQTQRQAAADARSRAEADESTASEKKDAALAAEREAAQARDGAVKAERARDALVAKAAAADAAAAAAQGTADAEAARAAANDAHAAADDATRAATAARVAADEATAAAVAAREAATKATAAASRSRAAADAAWADAATTSAAAATAHAAAADAIAASEQAANNVKAAEQQAKIAADAAATARTNAAAANTLADAARAEAARTAGQAYAAAVAARAAGDAALAVVSPANEAITLGTPFRETDSSAGMAVLVGQSALTLAEQQAAAAQANATVAAEVAAAAASAAAKAAANAKLAAEAAAAATADAASAALSLTQARASAAAAARDAAAAQQADERAAAYHQQAMADAFYAESAATAAESDATAARQAATAAEQDAASARAAATSASTDAAAARDAAAQADRDADLAEQAAANARQEAQEAQLAAERAEANANAEAEATALGPSAPTGMGQVIAEPINVNDEIDTPVDCQATDLTHCTATIHHHLTGQIIYFVRTCPDPSTTDCPGQEIVDYLGTVPLDANITETRILNPLEIIGEFWLQVGKALVSDLVDCAHGKLSQCGLVAAELVLPAALGAIARSIIAVRVGIRAGAFATELDTAFFWSGRTAGVGGDAVARSIASGRGGTTLEMLLDSRGITMPTWDPTNPATIKAWENASLAYAQGARGTVRAVIGDTLRPGNVWETIELPALKANPNVTQIIRIDPATGTESVIFTR